MQQKKSVFYLGQPQLHMYYDLVVNIISDCDGLQSSSSPTQAPFLPKPSPQLVFVPAASRQLISSGRPFSLLPSTTLSPSKSPEIRIAQVEFLLHPHSCLQHCHGTIQLRGWIRLE
jgi:hypothetical protein